MKHCGISGVMLTNVEASNTHFILRNFYRRRSLERKFKIVLTSIGYSGIWCSICFDIRTRLRLFPDHREISQKKHHKSSHVHILCSPHDNHFQIKGHSCITSDRVHSATAEDSLPIAFPADWAQNSRSIKPPDSMFSRALKSNLSCWWHSQLHATFELN